MAKLTRAEKIPSLATLLPREQSERAPQSPEEVRESILSWASAAGLKVERHEHPVIV